MVTGVQTCALPIQLVYNIFAGDILTSVFHNFKTEEDVEADKAQMSDIEARMELYQ